MKDNYIAMLQALKNNGWEFIDYIDNSLIREFTMKDGWTNTFCINCVHNREPWTPIYIIDDLLEIAGIDTWNDIETFYQNDPAFNKAASAYRNEPLRELLLVYIVYKKLGKVWNHELNKWEDV